MMDTASFGPVNEMALITSTSSIMMEPILSLLRESGMLSIFSDTMRPET